MLYVDRLCQIMSLHYLDAGRWTEVNNSLYHIVTDLCEEYMKVIHAYYSIIIIRMYIQ